MNRYHRFIPARVSLTLSLGILISLTSYVAYAKCLTKNSTCSPSGGSGGSAKQAYTDSARTIGAYIYCTESSYSYQECQSSGTYDNVYYKESVGEGACSASTWINAGSDGPTVKKVTDNNCTNS
jgi:hypothetical protein